MAIWLVETEFFEGPLKDPVGLFFGPLQPEVLCDWIAKDACYSDPDVVVPELEFPNGQQPRRTDWLRVGVRPPRPMPRGLRFQFSALSSAIGTEPPGVLANEYAIFADDVVGAERDRVRYVTDDDADLSLSFLVTTLRTHHVTPAGIFNYRPADFILESLVALDDDEGATYALLEAPSDWTGFPPVPRATIPSLMLSRTNNKTPPNKQRRFLFRGEGECGQDGSTAATTFPFFQDFDEGYYGPGRFGWEPIINTDPTDFQPGRWLPGPNAAMIKNIQSELRYSEWDLSFRMLHGEASTLLTVQFGGVPGPFQVFEVTVTISDNAWVVTWPPRVLGDQFPGLSLDDRDFKLTMRGDGVEDSVSEFFIDGQLQGSVNWFNGPWFKNPCVDSFLEVRVGTGQVGLDEIGVRSFI